MKPEKNHDDIRDNAKLISTLDNNTIKPKIQDTNIKQELDRESPHNIFNSDEENRFGNYDKLNTEEKLNQDYKTLDFKNKNPNDRHDNIGRNKKNLINKSESNPKEQNPNNVDKNNTEDKINSRPLKPLNIGFSEEYNPKPNDNFSNEEKQQDLYKNNKPKTDSPFEGGNKSSRGIESKKSIDQLFQDKTNPIDDNRSQSELNPIRIDNSDNNKVQDKNIQSKPVHYQKNSSAITIQKNENIMENYNTPGLNPKVYKNDISLTTIQDSEDNIENMDETQKPFTKPNTANTKNKVTFKDTPVSEADADNQNTDSDNISTKKDNIKYTPHNRKDVFDQSPNIEPKQNTNTNDKKEQEIKSNKDTRSNPSKDNKLYDNSSKKNLRGTIQPDKNTKINYENPTVKTDLDFPVLDSDNLDNPDEWWDANSDYIDPKVTWVKPTFKESCIPFEKVPEFQVTFQKMSSI